MIDSTYDHCCYRKPQSPQSHRTCTSRTKCLRRMRRSGSGSGSDSSCFSGRRRDFDTGWVSRLSVNMRA